MFIKREGKDDCIIAGMAVADMKTKTYDEKEFYEIGVGVAEDQVINVTVWNRKPQDIKKYDRVIACGKLKVTKKDDKTFYSLTADFVAKEQTSKAETQPVQELTEIDDDSLPF